MLSGQQQPSPIPRDSNQIDRRVQAKARQHGGVVLQPPTQALPSFNANTLTSTILDISSKRFGKILEQSLYRLRFSVHRAQKIRRFFPRHDELGVSRECCSWACFACLTAMSSSVCSRRWEKAYHADRVQAFNHMLCDWFVVHSS